MGWAPGRIASPAFQPVGSPWSRPGPMNGRALGMDISPLPASALCALLGFASLLLVGCEESLGVDRPDGRRTLGVEGLVCDVPRADIYFGGTPRDGLPSLTDPTFVDPGSPEAAYLQEEDRVIGILLDGEPLAIPHNILWWHEIVNLNRPSGTQIAVTYCPLTGSSMVFDREAIGGAELGVSGLIFLNNLIMWDRRSEESFWPQMLARAGCGPARGVELEMVPGWEMTWRGWQETYPEGQVVGSEQGMGRNYRLYPYGDYETLDNPVRFFATPALDPRRPPKERVLGIPHLNGRGVAIPFGELEGNAKGGRSVAGIETPTGRIVVFWKSSLGGAMAYWTEDHFRVEEGRFLDHSTGSEWDFTGVAVDGPLTGEALEPVAEAHVAFWFAWTEFHTDSELWTIGGGA